MPRWTHLFAGLAALVLAVALALELRDVGFWGWAIVVALAAAPVALYLGLTRWRAHTVDRVAFSVVLAADVALYVAALPAYDDSALGAVLFFDVPFYGVLGLLLTLAVLVAGRAVASRIAAARRGPPPTAAAGRP
jgi:hypothetical protein